MGAPPLAEPSGSAGRLALLGGLTLFLELALIRYLAGHIWNLGFFPNLVLLAAFVGMGLGFIHHGRLGPRASALVFQAAPWLLLALAAFVAAARPNLGFGSWGAVVGGELFFTAAPQGGARDFLLLPAWFLGVVAVFACVSQRTAKLFARFDPLRAYTLDIAGACCGIAAFMAASRLEWPATSWFLLLAGAWVLCGEPEDRRRWLCLLPLLGLAALSDRQDRRLSADPGYAGPVETVWSPYQKVELIDPGGFPLQLYVNGIPHQSMATPQGFETSVYQAPYAARRGAPYRSALILGAGSGNDAAAALRNGVRRVDAVEIDPVIARVGRRHHPLRPYDDARVRVTVDDGRAFMARARDRYDLVVFALTDSLVKVSPMAQLRLENFLFTRESVAKAFSLLEEGGDLVFYNYYRRDWLLEKIRGLLRSATGQEPEIVLRRADLCVLRVTRGREPLGTLPAASADTPTDDWPFPYLQTRSLPRVYAAAMAAVAVFAGLLLVPPGRGGEAGPPFRLRLAFLLMGAAFLLLETKSIVRFGLLFGTTWRNTSLVFLAILLLVLAANRTAAAADSSAPARRGLLPWSCGLLFVSCAAGLAVPLSWLLGVECQWLRFVLASALTFSPVYFANLVFSAAFKGQAAAERLFGWNLIGATLGGVLEYAGMATGYAALGVAVMALYGAVFLLVRPVEGKEKPPAPAEPRAS